MNAFVLEKIITVLSRAGYVLGWRLGKRWKD